MASADIKVTFQEPKELGEIHLDKKDIVRVVSTAVGRLAVVMRSNAPYLHGNLRRGIVPSPTAEKSASPYKVVYDVYWDERMNPIFVKKSKSGRRYYYPASQEYGFMIRHYVQKTKPAHFYKTFSPSSSLYYARNRRKGYVPSREKHVPGKYYMSTSLVEYVPVMDKDFEKLIEEALSND